MVDVSPLQSSVSKNVFLWLFIYYYKILHDGLQAGQVALVRYPLMFFNNIRSQRLFYLWWSVSFRVGGGGNSL